MASGEEEIVRLSHRELVNLSKMKSPEGTAEDEDASGSGKKYEEKVKKPERQIYMPGQMRLNRKKDGTDPNLQSEVGIGASQSENLAQKTSLTVGSGPECNELDGISENAFRMNDGGRKNIKTPSAKASSNRQNCASAGRGQNDVFPDAEAVQQSRERSHNYSVSQSDDRFSQECDVGDLGQRESSPSVEQKECKIEASELAARRQDDKRERKREKKPDIQLYVPKGRQQVNPTKDSRAAQVGESKVGMGTGSEDFKDAPSVNSASDTNAPPHASENELSAGQVQKVLPPAGDCKRKVTVKESLVEVTISQQKGERNSNSGEGKDSEARSKDQKQPKSRTRPVEAQTWRKATHGEKSPKQRLHHWRQTSGAGNDAEEVGEGKLSDVDEGEELEWDHQADLDLDRLQFEAGLNAEKGSVSNAGEAQNEEEDEEEYEREEEAADSELQSGASAAKQGRRRRNRKPKKRKTKCSGTTENGAVENNQEVITKHQTVASNQEIPALKVASSDDNFVGKLNVLVITNSKRVDSPNSNNISPQKSSVKREHNESHLSSGVSREPEENSSKDLNEKTKVDRKNTQEKKPMGMKYSSSKISRQSESKDTCDGENLCHNQPRKTPETARKADPQEGDKLSLSDITLSTRVGGIIRLPVGTTTSADQKPDHSAGRNASHGSKNYGRGRAHGRRSLWDPNQHSRGSNSPEISAANYSESPICDRSSQFSYSNETAALRDYDFAMSHMPSHTSPSPFYRPMTPFPQCVPVDNYGFRYPVPSPGFEGPTYDSNLMRDLYFQGYGDQSSMNVLPMPSPQLTNLVREAVTFDTQLSNLISRGINTEETLKRMTNLRMEISSRYEQAMLLDLEFSNQQNIGDALWRSAFYQVIEVFRKQMKESDSEVNKKHLLAVLDKGLDFFEKFLQKLQSKYNFSLERYLDVEQEVPECASRTTKLALIMCQRIMMCLGDLARYRELTNQSVNYGRARNWYMKAQQIAPKNGKPYNQLAVLALYTKRKLDAVYYYMRSLAATNPLLTARESVMSLFEEARRKMEQTERTRQMERAQRRRAKTKRRPSEQSHRLEIWISADGTSSQDHIRDDEDESDDVLGLSVIELNKRFALSFLNVHGKLFTKIGMESFPESVGRMLREFQILVCHSPTPITCTRLLELMTINMFTIENTIRRETSNIDEGCRSLIQEQSMQLGLEMFGLLVEHCIRLISDHLKYCEKNTEKTVAFGEDLRQLLPAVKVWSDWMICHNHLWNPPPIPFDPLLGPHVDVWKSMADLFNIISEVDTSGVTLHEKKTEGCKVVLLPEDVMLAGFVPLLSITNCPVFVSKDIDKELARDCLRVDKLRMFAEVVYGLDPAILSYSAETRLYTSLVESESKENVDGDASKKVVGNNEQALLEKQDSDDVIVESESVEFCGSEDDSQEYHISQLKARKQELTRQMAEQMKKQENLQAAIESSRHDFRRIELEIRPVFLVLDTNCLIDHLKSINKLLEMRKYTVIIPLVVINELDGLARNPKENCYDTIEHAEMVRMGAEKAVGFLEAEFERRNQHLKAVTSKGSILETIAFRSEEPLNAGTNDDLILNCCLRYCQDKARDFMPKSSDEPIHLYRDVVLLTNDRNLRLKAHLHNVPVKDIPSFLKWAHVG